MSCVLFFSMLLTASVLFLGILVGSLWAGYQSNRIGRKMSLIVDLLVMMSGNLVIGFSQSFQVLMAGRILNGLACGGMSCLYKLPGCLSLNKLSAFNTCNQLLKTYIPVNDANTNTAVLHGRNAPTT